MKPGIKRYTDFINEAASPKGAFEEFAATRYKGAEKIATSAKEKGGPSMLTYHHFSVKLPHYLSASQGKFNEEEAHKELSAQMRLLEDGIKKDKISLKPVEFQKIVGIIEVLGELLIKGQE